MWNICGQELGRQEKRQVILHPNGRQYEIPATLICGAQEGMTLLVTAQIHAAEYNGTAAVTELAAAVDPAKLKGNLILIHCVNTSGFWQQYPRFIPEDHVNLNADYPGRADGTIGQQIAAWFVKEVFPQVDFIADLHGGGISEILEPCIFYPRAEKVTDCALSAAKALNTRYLLASSNSVGEYGYAANHMDIPGLILERGYGAFVKEEWIKGHRESVELLMDHFGMYPLEHPHQPTPKKIYLRSEYLEADIRGVWYPAVQVNQPVKKGELLGRLGDFFGNTIREYRAAADGTVIYYTGGMSVLEGDALVAYGLETN